MHFTKPPARYTEASLVKALEREGIGRPSTYASIITTIQDRGYVEQKDRKFHATDLGEVVTNKLDEYFPKIMDLAFTRHMEEQLDKIEEQHLDWVSVLESSTGRSRRTSTTAMEMMKHAKAETLPSEYKCEKCGKPMVYRFGKNGRFLSCSDVSGVQVRHALRQERQAAEGRGQSEHQVSQYAASRWFSRTARFGTFLGCSDYPNCKTILRLDKEGNPLPPKPPASRRASSATSARGRVGHTAEQTRTLPGMQQVPAVQDAAWHGALGEPEETPGRREVAA